MKRKAISLAMAVLFLGSVTVLNTGCFGKFALTQKVYQFNKGLGNKFVQELGFILMMIIPVYEVAGLVDVVILNLIEFWTNSNPLALNEGEVVKQYANIDGKNLIMTATKGKVTVVSEEEGINIEILLNEENNQWETYKNNELIHAVRVINENGDVEVVKDGRVIPMNILDANKQALVALVADMN
jgi:hypothetical protein